jgi:L-aminopeptidase/D-esterase-like protein
MMQNSFKKQVSLWMLLLSLPLSSASMAERARDLGIPFDGTPGVNNALTDVAGVEVGYKTLISGQGPLVVGKGPIRTGVTAILPHGKTYNPVFAAWYSLNGAGELTGTTWVDQSGFLQTPILITNTNSVGVVRDAVIEWLYKNNLYESVYKNVFFVIPVVGETFDGLLNDIFGFHVTKQDAFDALDESKSGPIAEGNVGGGTGMTCYNLKCGTGTASRVLAKEYGGFTVGALVQANYGNLPELTIAGVPVGKKLLTHLEIKPKLTFELRNENEDTKKSVPVEQMKPRSSIIVVIATDAPLLPVQLKRLARRIPMGIARVGGYAQDTSGDIFIVFSTANSKLALETSGHLSELKKNEFSQPKPLTMIANSQMDALFEATVQVTEEAIINAMIAAKTMEGINNNTFYAIPHTTLQSILKEYNRLAS